MIFTAIKSYKLVTQCHRKIFVTADSIHNDDTDIMTRNKISGGHHNTLIVLVAVVTLLLASSYGANAEPVAPAQVAAAVAAATGTGENSVQPIETSPNPAIVDDVVVNSSPTTEYSLLPQSTAPSASATLITAAATGTEEPKTAEDGSYQKQPNADNNIQQDDERRHQQQLLLAPLLMPSESLSTVWPQQQSTAVDGLAVIPSLSSVIGRERTIMEIVPIPSASEEHHINAPLHQFQSEYNYPLVGNQQPEQELQKTEPEQRQQSEILEHEQQTQQQIQQTSTAAVSPIDQQQYSYFYSNNNKYVINNNHNNLDDDQQQQYSYHYYYQQNLAHQQQQQQQQQQQHQQQQQQQQQSNVAVMYSAQTPLQYGGGQLHYYNNFGGVGKYLQQQPQPMVQNHYYRARDGVGRPPARRNTRSQQQGAYDNNNFYHYPSPPVQQQQQQHSHQKLSQDHGGESDNVIGIKYDQDQSGKHQPGAQPPFRPSHPVWTSQYPVPWTYYVKSSMVQPARTAPLYPLQYNNNNNNYPHGMSRKSRYIIQTGGGGVASNRISGGGYSPAKLPPRTKVVYIEYGGFKPKMVPSVQIGGAEDFDNNNRRQSTEVEDDSIGSGSDGADGETIVTVTRSGSDDGDSAAFSSVDVAHRDNAVANTTIATVTAAAATTATVASTSMTTTTTTTTTAANSTTISTPQQPQQQQQTESDERQPPAAAGVVVVVV